MPNYQVGDHIFVPASLLGITNPPYAVVERTVLGNLNRSVRVDTQGGGTTAVASSRVFPRIGVLLLRIGDYGSESELLDPLYKSLLHYFRLLLGPEVIAFEIRSVEEFTHIWGQQHATKRYLIMVGHGRPDAVAFGSAGWIGAPVLGAIINQQGTEVSVLSTACRTGFKQFSQPLSGRQYIREVIAPHSSVPGAVASQFLQTYFAERLLEGRTEKSTFQQARHRVPGATNFRRWKDGRLNQ